MVHAVDRHVKTLVAEGVDFYGYALLPGEPPEIHSFVAAFARESEIKVERNHEQYLYHRYCVDEWLHYQHEGFDEINAILKATNDQYIEMHTEDAGNHEYEMDEDAVPYSNALLDAMTEGLAVAKADGIFGKGEKFLAVWISDCRHDVIGNSVRRLNSDEVVREFTQEFR